MYEVTKEHAEQHALYVLLYVYNIAVLHVLTSLNVDFIFCKTLHYKPWSYFALNNKTRLGVMMQSLQTNIIYVMYY